jgi:hypothetical protein
MTIQKWNNLVVYDGFTFFLEAVNVDHHCLYKELRAIHTRASESPRTREVLTTAVVEDTIHANAAEMNDT